MSHSDSTREKHVAWLLSHTHTHQINLPGAPPPLTGVTPTAVARHVLAGKLLCWQTHGDLFNYTVLH